MATIFVDADACPVKQEVYRVARRHGLQVKLVANSWLRTPLGASVELVVVEGGLDAADDWIAEHAAENDIVVNYGADTRAYVDILSASTALGGSGVSFIEQTVLGLPAGTFFAPETGITKAHTRSP